MWRKLAWPGIAAILTVCLMMGSYHMEIKAKESKESSKKTERSESVDQMEKEVAKLDRKMSEANEKYEKYTKEQSDLKKKIRETKKELEDAKKSRQDQYDTMSKRIKFLYENGDTAYLEIIFEAQSFSEFWTKAEYVNQIAKYDADMFKELKDTEEKIEKSSKQLEEDYDHVTELAKQAKKEKEEASQIFLDKKEKLKDYQKELAKNEKLQDAYEGAQQKKDQVYADAGDSQSSVGADKEISKEENPDEKTESSAAASTSSSSDNSNSLPASSGGLTWPVPSLHSISSGYGYRVHPVTGAYKLHAGIDIPCSTGTTIVAADSGTVEDAGYTPYNGNYIKIDHGNGLETMYLHCSSLLVSSGSHVSQGQTIAKSGATGMVSGAHLHFVVKKNGNYVNPMDYL